jgi:hypothetical protein
VIVNEVEERRVIRLLQEAANAVPPLSEVEVGTLLDAAGRGVAPGRTCRLPTRALLAAAAAAAVVAGTTVGSSTPGPGPAPATAQLASFPEGSALQLLISARTS